MYNCFQDPFRENIHIIKFILDVTIELLILDEKIEKISDKNVIINISKMSRVFYTNENSIHSMIFPFTILEQLSNKLYWGTEEITIDIVYNLKEFFEIYTKTCKNDNINDLKIESLYNIFAEFMYDIDYNDEKNFRIMKKFILKLLTMETGYIRYDYDINNQNGDKHPLYHLDLFCNSTNTFKIGLSEKLDIEDMIDILDIRSKCSYLQ